MIKFFTIQLVVVLLMVAGGVGASGEVAFIDQKEVFKRFYKTELAQDQVRQQLDDVRLERETIEEEVVAMKEEVEILRSDSRDTTLSDEIRQSKRDQLEELLVETQKKEREMTEYERLRRKQMEQQNVRMTKNIFDEINAVVIKYAKAKDYSAVIDRSAQSRNGTDSVLYVNPKVDITADVVKELNEGREESNSYGVEFSVDEAEQE